MVTAKRIVKTRKKTFGYRSHKVVSEPLVPVDGSNEDIWQAIMDYMERARMYLRPRFLDSSPLETIGPHVDWHGLIDNS